MQQGYTGPEVCKITGISYRQLDHWTTTKLINASIRNLKGSGFHRLYSFNDIVLVKLVNKLRDAGISLQKIRIALKNVSTLLWESSSVFISVYLLPGNVLQLATCKGHSRKTQWLQLAVSPKARLAIFD